MTPMMTKEDFQGLGAPDLVYVREIRASDVLADVVSPESKGLKIDPKATLFAVHAAATPCASPRCGCWITASGDGLASGGSVGPRLCVRHFADGRSSQLGLQLQPRAERLNFGALCAARSDHQPVGEW